MEKKLWLNAILISPIIAFYGIIPVYFIESSIYKIILIYLYITLFTLGIWGVNIFFILKYPKIHNIIRVCVAIVVMEITKAVLGYFFPILNFSNLIKNDGNTLVNILILFIPNIVILILCNNIFYDFKRNEAEKEIQNLKLENIEAQKQALVQQLQPHFLFNALGVLKSIISTNQVKAEDYVVTLSKFLQYSIHISKVDTSSVASELKFPKDYIELQKMRFDEAIQVNINLPDSINQKHIPILALQTLIENVFKHNHFSVKKPLIISIDYEEDCIKVTNQYYPNNFDEHTTKIGLNNLNNRYKLLANKQIKIQQTVDTFSVLIPLI